MWNEVPDVGEVDPTGSGGVGKAFGFPLTWESKPSEHLSRALTRLAAEVGMDLKSLSRPLAPPFLILPYIFSWIPLALLLGYESIYAKWCYSAKFYQNWFGNFRVCLKFQHLWEKAIVIKFWGFSCLPVHKYGRITCHEKLSLFLGMQEWFDTIRNYITIT